ncbi:hypothetical protein L596_000891 [Steinernema carpocapsae]|uniref:EGF-like domain-containing protein n=1 Tax=Steinernema carpocapsae TaxID=34508 RepID=A0A4U8ULR7_STECR|nr:hypothetical protein L596_000891 [Steinernema carpocapsae]
MASRRWHFFTSRPKSARLSFCQISCAACLHHSLNTLPIYSVLATCVVPPNSRNTLIMQFAASFVCCLLVASSVAFAKIQSHSEEFNLSCENGGSIKQSKCVCDRRFEGEHCEIEPCLNGGVKGHDGKCHCPFGLTGERCEKVTHCTDNGVLVNGTCKCEQRWGGIFCNVRTCHNGISVGAENSFCFCDLGFTGPFCDEELKCEHGTVTQNNQCECDPNWIGADCNQCAESFYQYNNECIELKPKNAQPILHSKQVPLTPILIVGGACFLLVIGVGVTLFYVMKRRTKHSPISSERASATDV